MEKEKPEIAVIDSIQTMYNEEVSPRPGSVSQVRESTNVLMQIAKGMGISIFIVGHVTKDGNVAGPRAGTHGRYRAVLRGRPSCVLPDSTRRQKTVLVLQMRSARLRNADRGTRGSENPSEYMLNGRPEGASGSVVACSMEGTRPILIEIQALVCHSNFGIPRRTAAGCDFNRVNLLMAVLENAQESIFRQAMPTSTSQAESR